MFPTYRAVLHGDHLEWEDGVPEQVRGDQSVNVFVTIIGQPAPNDVPQGKRMADALGRLAERGGPSSISDALDWQREQREDRPLPGRVT
jgi:hypothetical protein